MFFYKGLWFGSIDQVNVLRIRILISIKSFWLQRISFICLSPYFFSASTIRGDNEVVKGVKLFNQGISNFQSARQTGSDFEMTCLLAVDAGLWVQYSCSLLQDAFARPSSDVAIKMVLSTYLILFIWTLFTEIPSGTLSRGCRIDSPYI